jgi:hypothetical protein
MKATNPSLMITKMGKQKKFVSMLFVALLLVQLFIFYEVSYLEQDFSSINKEYSDLYSTTEQQFVDEVIRPQQRLMLSTIRQSWVQYLVSHKETELLLKDNNGRYIYADDKGKSIAFDEETMIMEKDMNYFNIKDKNTGKVLLSNCRQQWNTAQVKTILDIVATPVKAFGSRGDVIIFDSFTGEMIVDNSEDCKDTPEVLGKDGKRYITLDYKHPSNKNPEACKRVIENEMMWRKDTDQNSKMVYYFSEPVDMGTDVENFVKYPLGQYSREFQEKVILPYESVGIDGQPMQITIVLGAQEPEVSAAFKETSEMFGNIQNTFSDTTARGVLFPLISVAISLVVILLAMFILRINAYQCKICNNKKDSDSTQ